MADGHRGAYDDERILHGFGYKQELKRTLNLFSNFAVAFTYLSPVVGFYSLFAFGLGNGGPPSSGAC